MRDFYSRLPNNHIPLLITFLSIQMTVLVLKKFSGMVIFSRADLSLEIHRFRQTHRLPVTFLYFCKKNIGWCIPFPDFFSREFESLEKFTVKLQRERGKFSAISINSNHVICMGIRVTKAKRRNLITEMSKNEQHI